MLLWGFSFFRRSSTRKPAANRNALEVNPDKELLIDKQRVVTWFGKCAEVNEGKTSTEVNEGGEMNEGRKSTEVKEGEGEMRLHTKGAVQATPNEATFGSRGRRNGRPLSDFLSFYHLQGRNQGGFVGCRRTPLEPWQEHTFPEGHRLRVAVAVLPSTVRLLEYSTVATLGFVSHCTCSLAWVRGYM